MTGLRDAKEFDAWKLADDLRRQVRPVLDKLRVAHHYNLHNQLESAAGSACPNIAEGFARYRPRDFARFVRIARASLAETIDHLTMAAAEGCATPDEAASLIALANRACGACTRLAVYLDAAPEP
jgi:four helix bundle protein